MLFLLLTLFANGDTTFHWWVPPGFPEKPTNYSDWGDYSFYQTSYINTWDWTECDKHFDTLDYATFPFFNDSALFPYKINLTGMGDITSYGDSLFGVCNYKATKSHQYDGYNSVKSKNERVSIYWFLHQKDDLDTQRIKRNLWPYGVTDIAFPQAMAVENHYDTINVEKIKWYRHVGRWKETECDEIYQTTGSFCVYFIPTEKFDFHIICRTLIYLYNGNPWEGYPEEMLDTLPRVVIKNYPDQISELEKAVEETFRPK